MRRCLPVLTLIIAGCSPAAEPSAPASPTPAAVASAAPSAPAVVDDNRLACDTPFKRGETLAAIERRYGKDASREKLNGAEGAQYEALVLFPDDPARRMELTDSGDKAGVISSVTIGEGSRWRIGGIGPGSSLDDVAKANGGPFRLYGFSWDYGGLASDWRGGKLGKDGACHVGVVFAPREDADLPDQAMGDGEIASDLPALKPLGVHVSQMTLTYPD